MNPMQFTSRNFLAICLLIFFSIAVTIARADLAKDAGINLIPWPKQIELIPNAPGAKLTAASHIVATDPKLTPLAEILSDELKSITGLKLTVTDGPAAPGDVVLKIDPTLKADADILTSRDLKFVRVRDYAHTFEVTDRVTVTGFDYRAVAEGTSTLLQVMKRDGDAATVPPLKIKDWPAADYMGTMVDTARQDIPIEALKQSVIACRLYKVRYMHFHLSDDQGWTFPSTAYPRLGTANTAAHGGVVPRVYDLEELKDLVAFADARGVTLIPEIETPGHSGAARLAMPEIFDSIDPATGKLRGLALMNMVNPKMYEALDTIVGEACDVFKSSPYFHIGCDETNWGAIDRSPEVVAYMKEHGLDHAGLFRQHVLKMHEIVKKHGKQTIIWEGGANKTSKEIVVMTWDSNSRNAERLIADGFTTITVPWELGVPQQDWNMYICNGSVLKPTDNVLGAMVPMWEMSESALVNDYLTRLPERQERTWSPATTFTMDDFNKREAYLARVFHQLAMPVTVELTGLDVPKENVFYAKLTVALNDIGAPGDVRYTLDGTNPTAASDKYSAPIELTQSATIKAAVFDPTGKQISFMSQGKWTKVDFEQNLTTGKPVTTSAGTVKDYPAENAVDGRTDTAWWAGPSPQWLQIDLQQPYTIDRIHIFPFFDNHRHYQYTVDVSLDDKTWTQVIDMTRNEKPHTAAGDVHDIAPTPMRYIRVNMLRNSANEGVHIAEVRVYEVGKHPAAVGAATP